MFWLNIGGLKEFMFTLIWMTFWLEALQKVRYTLQATRHGAAIRLHVLQEVMNAGFLFSAKKA